MPLAIWRWSGAMSDVSLAWLSVAQRYSGVERRALHCLVLVPVLFLATRDGASKFHASSQDAGLS